MDDSAVLVVEFCLYEICLGSLWLSDRNICDGYYDFLPAEACEDGCGRYEISKFGW